MDTSLITSSDKNKMESSSPPKETTYTHTLPSSPTAVTIAGGYSISTQSSPCAGCKFLRRKCKPECVFAPYFPADQQQKFIDVHRVFGASNVSKILKELHSSERQEAATSLIYEAQMRLHDPIYGCVGVISYLQNQLQEFKFELTCASAELSRLESIAAGRIAIERSNPVSEIGLEELLLPDWLQQQQRRQRMLTMTTEGPNCSVHPPLAICSSDSMVAADSVAVKFETFGGGADGENEVWFDGQIL